MPSSSVRKCPTGLLRRLSSRESRRIHDKEEQNNLLDFDSLACLRNASYWNIAVNQSESGRSASAARGIWHYAFGLSHLFFDDTRCLENFGSCSSAHSQISLIEGMGVCRLFLCHDGSRIFAYRSGRSHKRISSVVVVAGPDYGLVVFQTCR